MYATASYLTPDVIEEIRSNPSLVVAYFDTYRSAFLSDLGMPSVNEDVLKAAWSSVVAHHMAHYGPFVGGALSELLATPTLECSGYNMLTWYFIAEFGLSTDVQVAVGWDGGAVGNHVQMLVSVDGSSAQLDATIGLIAFDVTFEGLIAGVQYDQYVSFYVRDDITSFNAQVINAVTGGLYTVQDVIYYVPGLDNLFNNYLSYVGITIEHGNDSQTIVGSLADDVIFAGPGDDHVYGGRGADHVYLEDGDDFAYEGFEGGDSIDGGSGTDTVVYSLPRSAYGIIEQDGWYQIVKPEGTTDTLFNIERLQFADYLVASRIVLDDVDEQFDWAQESTAYDRLGNVLHRERIFDDGARELREYDTLNQFDWWAFSTTFNALGDLVLRQYDKDDRSTAVHQYDFDHAAWDRISTYRTAAGEVERIVYDQDDGSIVSYQYDLGDAAWSRLVTTFNGSGDPEKIVYDQDDGSKVIYQHDLDDAAWSRLVTYFNRSGEREKIVYDQDDGTAVVYQYDVANTFLWQQLTSYFRPDSTLRHALVTQDDGSIYSLLYDEFGQLESSSLLTSEFLL